MSHAAILIAIFLILFNISGILPVYYKDRERRATLKHTVTFDDLRQPTENEEQWLGELVLRGYVPGANDVDSLIF